MDYLTKSYSQTFDLIDLVPMAYTPFRIDDQIKPAPMYHQAYRLNCGAVINMSEDWRQGAKIDIGGEALWNIRDATKWSDETILKMLQATPLHKRTTRIDYAFNIVGWGSMNTLMRAWNKGRCKTSFRTVQVIKKLKGVRGDTLYFGSKDSEFRVRAYDKAAEMDMLWACWLRVEAQFRGEYAANASVDAGEGVTLHDHSRTKIKNAVDYSHIHWWNEMFDGEKTEVKTLKRKESTLEKRMEQLLQEILKKAGDSPENYEYITNEWLVSLANGLRVMRE